MSGVQVLVSAQTEEERGYPQWALHPKMLPKPPGTGAVLGLALPKAST